MKALLKSILIFFVVSIISSAVEGQVLMTIGDKEITLDEFERIYNKNNNSLSTNQQTPEEYMELFINFKLKVIEAENLGMDTTKKFLDEFNGYKDQLAKPYMTDDVTKLALMKEAYERMQKDVHVSHILLKMDRQPSPEDTLIRYEMAMKIRQRIIDGEDFATVAKATSDDPGAKINGGDLGFFTVFAMLYPFETVAYNLNDGEVSMPVRTMYGYHIIKKYSSRPAIGQVKVAHIFIRTPEGMSEKNLSKAKAKAMEITDSLNNGSDFGRMVKKYSDDRNSIASGGELPWFGAGRMIKQFESKAFELKNPGDITLPFRTFYGWHIIKLLDKKGIGTYEEMESTLQSKALKGDRDRVKRKIYIDKLKTKYEYSLNEELYKKLYSLVDTSIFSGNWDAYKDTRNYDDYLFTISDGGVTLRDFVDVLSAKHGKHTQIPVENYIDMEFNKFLEKYMLDMEKASLPEQYPEFKYITQEYHDGILLFDLMDERVWTKAVEDSTGLESFFADHRSDYMWDTRMDAVIVSCDSTVDIDAVRKKASKISSGKWDEEKLNKKFCNDSVNCISLEIIKAEKGKNSHIDDLNNKPGTGETYNEDGKFSFVAARAILPPMEKELNETRGQVTSDYQDYLEKEWIKELREKYSVSVNNEMLSKIK